MLHAASVMSMPFIVPLFGSRFSRALLTVLESREHVEALIVRIENLRASAEAA